MPIWRLPEGKAREGKGILYLPDVIGIWQNSKLMADQYAANGYLTLVLDEFNGDPLSLNRTGDFDFMGWLQNGSDGKTRTPRKLSSVPLATALVPRWYVVRHYKDGIEVGYLAHPSFVDEEELEAITGPLSIAAAETDDIFPAEKRHKSEEILKKTGQPYQINLYSGVSHGFSVRGKVEVQVERFAKEQAFLQAVTWFNEFL
ncbi:unnamed protein product [Parascedosporium putredinis]|uniref:Dienelactone hydrolase domain-containing protein n=1 Tax=Parascedosporium putredinis TaxID=1442378 RepID=A0A9P1HAV2_9PEZI|nr:unnamed protein product [Parascedosporium putredinis]CAI8004922.1 unnamed protein product [Parascedosporium putredinis]